MGIYTYRTRVCYGETDKMGVVYYANYFVWYERARSEFLRAFGYPYIDMERNGLYLPVINASCKYISSARYDDVVEVETWIAMRAGARVAFRYAVRDSGRRLIATGETVHGVVNEHGRPGRLEETAKNFIEEVIEEDLAVPE